MPNCALSHAECVMQEHAVHERVVDVYKSR
jgi:hypothetical protein